MGFCEASVPAVMTSIGVFLVFIQAGFAVDPPTAWHLVGYTGYMKADLALQLVWWCVHKLAFISASLGSIGSIGSHLLQRVGTTCSYICRTTIWYTWYNAAYYFPFMLVKLTCVYRITLCRSDTWKLSGYMLYQYVTWYGRGCIL